MRRVIVIVRIAFVTQALAKEPVPNQMRGTQQYSDNLVRKIVPTMFDKFSDQSFKISRLSAFQNISDPFAISMRRLRHYSSFATDGLSRQTKDSWHNTRRDTLFSLGAALLPMPTKSEALAADSMMGAAATDVMATPITETTGMDVVRTPTTVAPVAMDSMVKAKITKPKTDVMVRDPKTGLLYQEVRFGEGPMVGPGDAVAIDWACFARTSLVAPWFAATKTKKELRKGFNIQGKLVSKKGSLEGDLSALLRFRINDGTMIGAINEAVNGMRVGGIRRVIAVPGNLYYPDVPGNPGTQTWKAGVGPVPNTFQGRRALENVLSAAKVKDKSLAFDIELLSLGKGGILSARRGRGVYTEKTENRANYWWEEQSKRSNAADLDEKN